MVERPYYKNPKIKNYNVDARMRYFEALNKEFGLEYGMNCFSVQSIEEILAMACENIVPNGHYSDGECTLWEAMRRVLRHEKMIDD